MKSKETKYYVRLFNIENVWSIEPLGELRGISVNCVLEKIWGNGTLQILF